MNSETRNCKNCRQSFTIEPDDFAFYEKIKVPPPTWCPECRAIRRFAFNNIWSLYKRPCAKCLKNVVSIYSPDNPTTVYCPRCWWADDWDGTEFGLAYDPSRPFLEQVKELNRKAPRPALESDYLTLTNTEYANALGHCKNCYLIFWADYCENVFHSSFLLKLKDSLDCYRMNECELCYEGVGCKKCYRTFFSEECDSCTDVWFSRSCMGCTNCFGCINLRNKSYCIFNAQYSREEYLEKLKSFRLDSRESLRALRKKTCAFWDAHPRRAYIGNSLNVNVSGDYIYESKNARDAYMVSGVEDSRYTQFISVAPVRNSYDYSGWGNGAEQTYECSVVGEGVSKIRFTFECFPNALEVEYSIYAIACKYALGCVSLKRKNYCILNKEYSKEEFERLSAVIREDMVKNPYMDAWGRKWSYGEFLPVELSAFAYNETLAHQFYPKTKEEVLALGMRWYEGEGNQYAVTKRGDALPDTIAATDDAVVNEAVGCEECGKAFRVIASELALMRILNLPLPRTCPNCRQKARFMRTNLPRIYARTCAKCGKAIKTSYSPERPEIVYCEQCYQAEVA